ncbi:transcription factor bHLH90 [Apium graveolens]|uniref:transcription factor bHLH90 n=1 Tax=Apium graveolens TaxID=4045 RepID=UPI003D7A39D5
MGALKRVVELLRPLVKNGEWDYCVIWKLGDDPSSFIKWVDCCCGGGGGVADGLNIVKDERSDDVKPHIFPICKDIYVPHLAKTKACEALAKYPDSMPLYSGIHGDVAISNTQMWLTNNADASNPKLVETQVIIPVVGGLIELFSTKNVPKDQKLVEYITAHYNISLEHEIMTGHCDPFDTIVMPKLQTEAPNCSIEGSPTGSAQLHEYSSLPSCSTQVSLNKSTGNSLKYWDLNSKTMLSTKNEIRTDLVCSKRARDRTDRPNSRQRTGTESYQSKNVFIERNRRQRIKDGLFTLRALVPKISKMDRASILGDAVDYIMDLRKMIACFQTELKELEEVECSRSSPVKQSHVGSTKSTESQKSTEIQDSEVQMEVIRIGKREFLLKFIHSRKQAGFLRLLEAIHSLGHQVVDINVTTCEGKVLNIFKIEVNRDDTEPNDLKDSLLAIWTSKSDVIYEEKCQRTVIHQEVQVGM